MTQVTFVLWSVTFHLPTSGFWGGFGEGFGVGVVGDCVVGVVGGSVGVVGSG